VNKEGENEQVRKFMQKLAEDAYFHIENVKENKKYLNLLVNGMLLR